MRRPITLKVAASLLALLAPPVASAQALPDTSDAFDKIRVGGSQLYQPRPVPPMAERRAWIAEAQIVMDRGGISPGVIDGLDTRRFRLALGVWNSLHPEATLSPERRSETTGFVDYTVTAKDVSATYMPILPVLYVDQTDLPSLAYRNTREMLAERFHIDEHYLQMLNPGADFEVVGTVIRVPDTGRDLQKRVVRIEADKRLLQVRAYAAGGELVAAYPASIGSRATPSPSGTHTVRNKAQNPGYTYDPAGSAQPGLAQGLVRLPSGPNGPVGNAWIGLSKKTYGIHGTPEPSDIGVTASVGCVRLTNWDALELARLVQRGVEVTFVEGNEPS